MPVKPGSRAEHALSMEVLLNLYASTSVHKYGASNITEDFYALLQISLSIRDNFVGPFQPFGDSIFEKLESYGNDRNISDLSRMIVNYSKHEAEIDEFVSLKMFAALPYTYDRFFAFLLFRPTVDIDMEPVDKLAKKVRNVYESIIKPGGIFEKSQHLTNELAQPFETATEYKNAAQATIEHMFKAIDRKNEKQYNELKGILEIQLNKLIEDINRSTQILRRLKIQPLLLKLSMVHKKLYKTAVELFRDEFKAPEVFSNEAEAPNPADDSLNVPYKDESHSMPSHSPLSCTLLKFTLFITFLYIFTRFNRYLHVLWKCLCNRNQIGQSEKI